MYVNALPICRSGGTGVTDSFEPLCGCWEQNPDTTDDQQVLLLLNHLSKLQEKKSK